MNNDNMVLTEEQILTNWELFNKQVEKLGDRSTSIKAMLDDLGERLVLAPASSRREFHAAYPGGLVDHSLRVLKYALILWKSVDIFKELSTDSIIFASLFHDIGKVGMPGSTGADYYIPEESDWHRTKLGQLYKVNPDKQKMMNVDHSMLLMLHYGIKPTTEEFLAIRLNDGAYERANESYAMHEGLLPTMIHMADRLACEAEKNVG